MKTITDTITLALPAAAFPMDPERILFFDIETTGLSPRASSLYLIGTRHASGADQYTITQWFADTSASEQEMLTCFLEQLEHYDGLCHFNGRTFDIPYILNKCDKYHITPSSHCQDILSDTTQTRSFDMLLQLRPLKKLFGLTEKIFIPAEISSRYTAATAKICCFTRNKRLSKNICCSCIITMT